GGAVRGVDAAEHARAARELLRLLLREQLKALGGPRQLTLVVDELARPQQLSLVARKRDGAAARIAGVDALGVGDAADLGHGLVHRAPDRHRGLKPVRARYAAGGGREERRAPAAVPAGRPVPGDLALDDHDAQ